MPYADPKKRAAVKADWYARNKERVIDGNLRRRHQLRERVRQYKLERGCSVCGYKRSYRALEFHHRNGSDDKLATICQMISRRFAWAKIEAELAKCDLVCSNCHRELHDEQPIL